MRRVQRLLVVVFALAISYPLTRPALGVLALDRASSYLMYGNHAEYDRLLHRALSFYNGPEELQAVGDAIALNPHPGAADRTLFEHALAQTNDPDLWWDESLVAMREKHYERACTALSHTSSLHNPTLERVGEILGKKLGRSCFT